MDLQLKGKNALVCGSSKGIGKSTAIALSREGANIILMARDESRLQEVLEELDTSMGQVHRYHSADFLQTAELRTIIQHIVSDATIHILINNTGGPKGGPIINADVDEFRKAYNMHLVANHTLTQAVVPGMKAANYGRIINIISTSVKSPINGLGVSNTTRGAVASWAKTMANELGPDGITVNNVLPGFTDTSRLDEIIESKAQKQYISSEQVKANMMATVPARRFAHPDETAMAITFLASSHAAYINGINLPVDGGRTTCL